MELEKSRNARRNIFWGILNRFVSIILPFINRTVFLYILGVELLGLNSLFMSVLQVLNLAEMGVGSAMVFSMYRPIAEGNRNLVCALLSLYRKIYRWIGIVILLGGLILMNFLPYLVHDKPPDNVSLYWPYLIYLLNTVISYFCFGYKSSLPTAFQRTDFINNISSMTKVLESCIQIFFLYIVSSYYIYLSVMPFVTLLNNIMIARLVDKNYPEYHCEGIVPRGIKRNIFRKVCGIFIDKVCGTTRNSLDSICISMYVGLSITAIYNNYLYVVMAVTGVFGVIGASIVAGIGNSMVIYDCEKNYQDMRRINFIYMIISGWITVAMFSLLQPFMELWVGEKLMFSLDVVFLLSVYFYMLRMGDVRAIYSNAAGLWWETRYRAIVESVANVLLNLVLGKLFGVIGIILATILSLFFINFCWGSQIVFLHYFKNGKIGRYYIEHMMYGLGTIIVAIVTFLIATFFDGGKLENFLYRSIVCLIIPAVLYYLLWHRTNIYCEAMEWFLVRMKMKRKFKFLLR